MRSFDLSPLLRSTVGFDRLSRAVDTALQMNESAQTYPPYNIEKLGDDAYRISMAVAGFGLDDLELVTHEGTLSVRGKGKPDREGRTYLYRGIAERGFERRFHLADYIRVAGARLTDGMLHIDLVREVPDQLKPRRIDIAAASPLGAGPQRAAA